MGFAFLAATPAAFAQTAEELASDQAIQSQFRNADEAHRLALQLSQARKAGNVERARELERVIFTAMPSLPEAMTEVQPGGDFDLVQEGAAPMWGGDVKVYTGNIFYYGKRQIAIDADTAGGIYLAFNAVYRDTVSVVRAYRSTNGGTSWTYLNGFTTANYPIQSFDMCVTDTAGGKWVLGFAFIVKNDRTANGGGNLWWGKFMNDGTGWGTKIIASATTSTAFRNPSICTDGTFYIPTSTYHYVACEYITPATDASRGLFITRTQNWGNTWSTPDTTIRGFTEATPVIAIDWSSSPDSLVVAFSRLISAQREIRMARNSLTFTTPWALNGFGSPASEYDPSLAIDPVRGNAMITYTRASGAPTYNDAMYLYSTDLFRTYKRDSIASTVNNEDLTSVSYAPWGTGYYWRVVYHSSVGNDSIYYKALLNTMSSFYTAPATKVNQYRPSGSILPVAGFDRDAGGTFYRGNAAYAGYGPTDIYFDAVDLTLTDVEEEGTVPAACHLDQNYPNPFNPTTSIQYQLPAAGGVKLAIYDLLGREVAVLVDEVKGPGFHVAQFDAQNLASGIYLYRLTAGSVTQSRRMVLMK
jgi:hypothetical protein